MTFTGIYYIVEFHGPKGWEILTETDSFREAVSIWTRELEQGEMDCRITSVGVGNQVTPESRRV